MNAKSCKRLRSQMRRVGGMNPRETVYRDHTVKVLRVLVPEKYTDEQAVEQTRAVTKELPRITRSLVETCGRGLYRRLKRSAAMRAVL